MKILVISQYPDKSNIKDGMVRRINEIDQKLEKNYNRTYLDISFKKNFKKEIRKEKNLEVYKVNFFKDFLFLFFKVKESKIIYIHSLHNYLKIFLIPFVNRKKLILDVHGVVVEETEFENKIKMAKLFKWIEKKLFKNLDKAIFVTKQMQKFYEKKYSQEMKSIKCMTLPIIEENRDKSVEISEELKLKIKDKTIIIYSGNLQKWQNIDTMMDLISKNLSNKLFYIILTGQKEEMERRFKERNISSKYFLVDSVLPSELSKYYEISNYGFILRDDHVLNRVANPTKLGEYLDYGIIPIVKLNEIGDYKELGYEYITIENFNNNLFKIKSQKNIEIMKKYRKEAEKLNFLKFIED